MDISFTIDADNFDEAKDRLYDLLRTDNGDLRAACTVLDDVCTDYVSNKEFKVVDGCECELTAFRHPEWREKGLIDVKK